MDKVIKDNWYITITKANINLINEWRQAAFEDRKILKANSYAWLKFNGFGYSTFEHVKDLIEITDDEFKKHVLYQDLSTDYLISLLKERNII